MTGRSLAQLSIGYKHSLSHFVLLPAASLSFRRPEEATSPRHGTYHSSSQQLVSGGRISFFCISLQTVRVPPGGLDDSHPTDAHFGTNRRLLCVWNFFIGPTVAWRALRLRADASSASVQRATKPPASTIYSSCHCDWTLSGRFPSASWLPVGPC